MNSQHQLGDSSVSRGYSYVQILLVIALLAMLAAVTSPYYLQWQQRQRLASTTLLVFSDLRIVQTRAKQRTHDAVWGMHIDDSAKAYIIFHGLTYNPADQYNYSVSYPASVTLSPNQDMVFSPVTGAVSSGSTVVTVSSVNFPTETEQITLNDVGLIELQ